MRENGIGCVPIAFRNCEGEVQWVFSITEKVRDGTHVEIEIIGYHRFLQRVLHLRRNDAGQREEENTHWHLGKISSEDAGDVMRRILLLLPV